ncbi:MAG: hypothetical protein ACXVD1_07975 [Nocardioides sp.]
MLPLLISLTATDPVPTDDSVKAGWTAFVIFLLLGLAIVFLGWSFSRQMKKVKKADAEGVYGPPSSTTADADAGADLPKNV